MRKMLTTAALLALGCLAGASAGLAASGSEKGGAAPASENTVRSERMAAIYAQLTEEQRASVEAFRAQFEANKGKPVESKSTAEGRTVIKVDRGLHVMVARNNADGTKSTACVRSADEFALFLAGKSATHSHEGVSQ